MKKFRLMTGILFSMLFIAGCSKSGNNNANQSAATPSPAAATLSPTAPPVTTPTAAPTAAATPTPAQETKTEDTIKDYYPFRENTEYIYQGTGNEYASYTVFTDYKAVDRVQYRINNGGSETVEVLEYDNGKLAKIFSKGEVYYRENFLDKEKGEEDILLMEPLVKGTEWTVSDNRKRYISNTGVEITTPAGTFSAIEVTTTGGTSNEKTVDYYAKDVGLVKSVFTSGTGEITSALGEIKENTPFTQKITFYYPNADTGKIYASEQKVSFQTNDVTRKKLEETAKKIVKKNYAALLTKNVKINSLSLHEEKVVYADFSKELATDMNAGSEYETLALQCITNTLGNYYNVKEVYITLEGKPYTSGHIEMKKGETLKVNYDNVIK